MFDIKRIIKNTTAYKILKKDKEQNSLSHAYLIVSKDSKYLKTFLKIFAKLICCKKDCCEVCRTCNLIENEKHLDVSFLPTEKEVILTKDVDFLTENAFVKPYEEDKRLFILLNAESMNGVSQNKLLKILEEPPKNVHILLGATTDYPLLQTVKSRVKKLEIPSFSFEELFDNLKEKYLDTERLKIAVANSDFTFGDVERLYENEEIREIKNLADDVIVNLNSSSQVAEKAYKIMKKKGYFGDFLKFLENNYRDMLLYFENKKELIKQPNISYLVEKSVNYKTQSVVASLDKIKEARKRLYYNGNEQMILEWLLLQILEVKYIWQKLSV